MIKALSLGNGVSLSLRLGCMLESVEQQHRAHIFKKTGVKFFYVFL